MKLNLMNCSYFYPCNPATYLKITASVLLYRIVSTVKVVYLVAFDDVIVMKMG